MKGVLTRLSDRRAVYKVGMRTWYIKQVTAPTDDIIGQTPGTYRIENAKDEDECQTVQAMSFEDAATYACGDKVSYPAPPTAAYVQIAIPKTGVCGVPGCSCGIVPTGSPSVNNQGGQSVGSVPAGGSPPVTGYYRNRYTYTGPTQSPLPRPDPDVRPDAVVGSSS